MNLPPRIQTIVQQVATERNLMPSDLFAMSQTRRIAHARHEAWRRIRALDNPPSYPLIGRWFNRDHSTVVHGVRNARV